MSDAVVFYNTNSVGSQEEHPETEPIIMILLIGYVEVNVLGEVSELLFLAFGVSFWFGCHSPTGSLVALLQSQTAPKCTMGDVRLRSSPALIFTTHSL
jgi:hypothetical protein